MSTPYLLTLNAGSSSLKIGLFSVDGGSARAIGRGQLDLQRRPATLSVRSGAERVDLAIDIPADDDLQRVLDAALVALARHFDLGEPIAAGHRVVHGGLHFRGPVRIGDASLAAIEALMSLAPLHQPQSLSFIRTLRRLRPELTQTASFDTAFHATQSDLVRRYALPRELHDQGVRRYGFHGLSYRYIAGELARRQPALASARVVVAHLGSGASACALQGGRSVDCSMGFSTLDGLPMATRCGPLDAGVVLYLIGERKMSVRDVEDLLYHRSGLLGVSGSSADMRVLEVAAAGDAAAREALDLFALRTAGEVARLASTLGGLDALVFTAGIGTHDAAMRGAICARLAWLGVTLDAAENERHAERIEAASSRVAVLVIATDEEQVIADDAMALLEDRP